MGIEILSEEMTFDLGWKEKNRILQLGHRGVKIYSVLCLKNVEYGMLGGGRKESKQLKKDYRKVSFQNGLE